VIEETAVPEQAETTATEQPTPVEASKAGEEQTQAVGPEVVKEVEANEAGAVETLKAEEPVVNAQPDVVTEVDATVVEETVERAVGEPEPSKDSEKTPTPGKQ